ncbi:MAG: hypothetical protein WBW36_00415 [Candidatus Sulfotelmatobacter sp.]
MSVKKSNSRFSAGRRKFFKTTVVGSATLALAPVRPALAAARELISYSSSARIKAFELDELTITDLQAGMKSGRFTARSLVEKYSSRIDEIDKHGPAINSVI